MASASKQELARDNPAASIFPIKTTEHWVAPSMTWNEFVTPARSLMQSVGIFVRQDGMAVLDVVEVLAVVEERVLDVGVVVTGPLCVVELNPVCEVEVELEVRPEEVVDCEVDPEWVVEVEVEDRPVDVEERVVEADVWDTLLVVVTIGVVDRVVVVPREVDDVLQLWVTVTVL
jgi:hypothetical protein